MPESQRENCVGVICFRGDEVLLIKRGKPPRKGEWSIPGGRIELGETEEVAALRELVEETGVIATLGIKVETVLADFEGRSLALHDYVAVWVSGEPVAGDDAAHAEFVSPEKLARLKMCSETRRVIEAARNLV